jgi:hypothetical protein
METITILCCVIFIDTFAVYHVIIAEDAVKCGEKCEKFRDCSQVHSEHIDFSDHFQSADSQ